MTVTVEYRPSSARGARRREFANEPRGSEGNQPMTNLPDPITIGGFSVDFHGGQVEDMGSFDKYIGGGPTNIARDAS